MTLRILKYVMLVIGYWILKSVTRYVSMIYCIIMSYQSFGNLNYTGISQSLLCMKPFYNFSLFCTLYDP